MAKLVYPDIIVNDPKYVALANLSNQLDHLNHAQIMTTIVELLGDEFIPLLAEKWSVTGYDGEFI
ncbi:phage tail protein, partial [Glaesserella parasuis]